MNMNRYERVISAIKQGSNLLKMIQSGIRPEEIKQAVIESLDPYFENKDVLQELAVEALVGESINLSKLQKDRWLVEMFEKCLFTYRSAKGLDAQSCFEACGLWQPIMIQSVSKFWSVLYLEVDKNVLEFEEFLHECMGNIGDIIEGLMKPYLKALVHQMRIANGISTTFAHIDSLDLGKIVDELIQKSGYPDLFMPPPWKIRLNHWRNIAYHHTARIENNQIICWFGKVPAIRKIWLLRNELVDVVHTIFEICRTLKLAATLFFADNSREIAKFSQPIDVRFEAELVNLVVGLASQGFEVVDLRKNPDEAKLVIRDNSNLDPNKRRLHASQFVFPLWTATRSREVIVEYREKDNTPNLEVSANSAVCQKIYDGELAPLALAKTLKIIKLKVNNVSRL